ncbi:hypothetical protein KIPB_008095, partial [Kipferlia bialata]
YKSKVLVHGTKVEPWDYQDSAWVIPSNVPFFMVNQGGASANTTLSYETEWHDSDNNHVMTFFYDVLFVPFGECEGHGQFLTWVNIKVTDLWLADHCGAEISWDTPAEPVNLGSISDPVAGVELRLGINTTYKGDSRGIFYYSWFLEGNGKWEQM